MRKLFFKLLLEEMIKNPKIFLVTGDLGFGLMDEIREKLPNQFLNVGAAEQCGIDVCVGLALSGKIPFWYSITPFAIYRPFETLRTYINHENIPVKIIGMGRDKDYELDGISHWCEDECEVMGLFRNIWTERPDTEEQVELALKSALTKNSPVYINLRRD